MDKIKEILKEFLPIFIVYILVDIFAIGAVYIAGINSEGNFNISRCFENISDMTPFETFARMCELGDNFAGFMTLSFYVFIVFVIMFIYYKFKNGPKHDYDGTENGSSEWAKSGEEFKKLQDGSEILNKKDGFILTKDHYLGTDQRKVKINKNILVVGGSGAGKSACYVKPNIMQKLGSYIITDPKGEMYRDTAGYLKANGYKIKVLNLIETEYSNRYNPLAHVKDHNDVNIISETIIRGGSDSGGSSDPFWDNTAIMLLKACIYYVKSVLPEEEQNLSSCLNIIRAGGSDEKILDRLFVDELKPEHPGRKEYESIRLAADKTKQSIAISVAAKLKDFDTPTIQRVTTSNEFDFSDLAREKTAIYIITPPDHSTYDYILTVFFSQMFQSLYSEAYKNGGTLNNPIYMLLDEFVNIGQIPDFPKKLSTTRSYGISVSIIVQAMDQLEALYKENYETIIGNCDTQLFLGSQSIKTCEYFSKSLGQKTIKYKSKSVNKDKKGIETQGMSYSDQTQARDLMTVDEIKRLDPQKAILLIRGLRPIIAKKAWYFTYHKERKIIENYKIRSLSETPKPEAVDIYTFDVNKHLDELDKKIEEYRSSKKVDVSEASNVVEKPKTEEEKFDLQQELEKKFDELFGSDSDD